MAVYDRLYDSVRTVIEGSNTFQKKRGLSFFLHLLSVPYRLIVIARYLSYRYKLLRTRRLPVPVISVGNLTLGGSGKTPVVSLLARLLLKRGIKPAIVSRGYGGRASERVNVVSDGKSILLTAELSGDEPYMLADKLPGVPVVTGKSRFLAGSYAAKNLGAEVIILDDGYQHMQLFRDLNILLIDGKNYFGNGYLFPRGPLREPEFLKKRADLVLFTKCEGAGTPPQHGSEAKPVFRASIRAEELVFPNTESAVPVNTISGRRVYAFCGIGDPHSFFRLLSEEGAVLVGQTVFNDHYQYDVNDIKTIVQSGERAGAHYVITTEKDFVRTPLLKETSIPVIVLKMDLDIVEGLESFEKAVFSHLPL